VLKLFEEVEIASSRKVFGDILKFGEIPKPDKAENSTKGISSSLFVEDGYNGGVKGNKLQEPDRRTVTDPVKLAKI
jgi:hypothetical protein